MVGVTTTASLAQLAPSGGVIAIITWWRVARRAVNRWSGPYLGRPVNSVRAEWWWLIALAGFGALFAWLLVHDPYFHGAK